MTQVERAADAGDQAFPRRRRFARECALQVLYQLDANTQAECPDRLLSDFWKQKLTDVEVDLSERELPEAKLFAERLIRGVASERRALDQRLGECAENWTVERMGVVDRNILRLATYELIFCEEIPAIATINEAIELAKQFGDRNSPGFVNGVLDRMLHADADTVDTG